jgi:hypothetical protein
MHPPGPRLKWRKDGPGHEAPVRWKALGMVPSMRSYLRRSGWDLAATIAEARTCPRDDPSTLLATNVVVVDVRACERVVVSS